MGSPMIMNPRARRLLGLPPMGVVPSFTNEDLEATRGPDLLPEQPPQDSFNPFSSEALDPIGAGRQEEATPPGIAQASQVAAAPPPPPPARTPSMTPGGGEGAPIRGIFPVPSAGPLMAADDDNDKPSIAQSAVTSKTGPPARGIAEQKALLAAPQVGPQFFDPIGMMGNIPKMLGEGIGAAAQAVGRFTHQLPSARPSIAEAGVVHAADKAPVLPTPTAAGRTPPPARGPNGMTGAPHPLNARGSGASATATPSDSIGIADIMGPSEMGRGYTNKDLDRVHRTGASVYAPKLEDVAYLPDSVLEERYKRKELAELNAPEGELTPTQRQALAFETAKGDIRFAAMDKILDQEAADAITDINSQAIPPAKKQALIGRVKAKVTQQKLWQRRLGMAGWPRNPGSMEYDPETGEQLYPQSLAQPGR
jgi:hypothetical protein